MKITQETLEEIKYLHSIGMKDAYIAEKLGCCKATINLYRNGKRFNRKIKLENPAEPAPIRKKRVLESVNYSELPDTVLFNPDLFPSF